MPQGERRESREGCDEEGEIHERRELNLVEDDLRDVGECTTIQRVGMRMKLWFDLLRTEISELEVTEIGKCSLTRHSQRNY